MLLIFHVLSTVSLHNISTLPQLHQFETYLNVELYYQVACCKPDGATTDLLPSYKVMQLTNKLFIREGAIARS